MEKTLAIKLAKVLIAAAWSDGELSNDEMNAFKDLLFNIPDLSGEEWPEIEVYMESPVKEEEAQQLIEDAVASIKSNQDKADAREFLDRLVSSDGIVTQDEQSFLDEVLQAIDSKKTGIMETMTSIIKSSLSKRRQKLGTTPSREERIEDFIKNTVYFKLKTEISSKEISFDDIGDNELRKLCLAAGIMAVLAWVDKDISPKEKNAINNALSENWGLDANRTSVVTELACSKALKGLDRFRLCRSFFKCTDYNERTSFLKTLFSVANSSENTSNDEIEEIRTISKLLRLGHKDFIDAKLTVPRDDRGGL